MARGLAPHPRLVDWALLAGAVLVLATGAVSLVAGRPGDAWVFVLHGAGGLALAVVLAAKLYRVRARLARPTPTRALSALLALVTLGAVATGVWWVHGGALALGPWGLLNLHIGFGLLVAPLLAYHLARRFRLPRRSDLDGRRSALRAGALLVGAAAAWRLQGAANRALDTAGATRRFTGSRERGSDAGNAFPVTAWVLDDPDPVDAGEWRLRVSGPAAEPLELARGDLTGADGGDRPPESEERAVLDCTSGWYSEHAWQGVRVGDLLAEAGVDEGARWVQFRSVTGYRWSLPLEEARGALLATRVDGEVLSHGHGFPLRLVAPGRRGFQWVKWVEEVRVTRRRERSEWVAVFVSGLE